MAHVFVILVTKETVPDSKLPFKKMMVPCEDCLRITHGMIPKRFEIKLGHFWKLYQELRKHMKKHFLEKYTVRRAT